MSQIQNVRNFMTNDPYSSTTKWYGKKKDKGIVREIKRNVRPFNQI